MKTYPSIEKRFSKKEEYYFFDKLDGSNIRAEWSKKQGFYKFGSRKQLIDENSGVLGESIELIKRLEEEFSKIAKENKWDRFIAFFEFLGDNSFAGNHENEVHKVVLIDISIYKKGFLDPISFLKIFEENEIIETPAFLGKRKPNELFLDEVKSGILEGMTFEGVIGKRSSGKTTHDYFKVKNIEWLNKLKNYCGNNIQLYNRLK